MKNKTKVIIKIIAVLLVSGMICALNSAPGYHWVRMTLCTKSYYRALADEQIKGWMVSAEDLYTLAQKRLEGTGNPRRITCRMEPGDTLKALSGDLGLDSASLIVDGERDGEEVSQQLTLQMNEKDALHVNGYLHYGERHGFVQIPEFSEARLTFSKWIEERWDESSQKDQFLFCLMGNVRKYLPQAEELSALLTKYRYLILDQEVDVTQSREKIQAGGISKKCTRFTASYSGESCYQAVQELLKDLEQDLHTLAEDRKKDLEENAPELTWEMERDIRMNGTKQMTLEEQLEMVDTGYQAARDFLIEKQEEWTEHKEQFLKEQAGMIVQMSVDSMGNIVERSIAVNMGEKTATVRQLMLRDGSDLSCEISVCVDDITYLQISGNGTVHGGKLSGDFDISLDESLNPDPVKIQSMDHIMRVSVQELDLSALIQKQEIQGEVEISTEQIPALKYYRLKIGMESAGDQGNYTVQILTGETVFATVYIQLQDGVQPEIGKRMDYDGKKNSYRLSDLGELANYVNEVDMEQVLEKIEKNCGVHLLP